MEAQVHLWYHTSQNQDREYWVLKKVEVCGCGQMWKWLSCRHMSSDGCSFPGHLDNVSCLVIKRWVPTRFRSDTCLALEHHTGTCINVEGRSGTCLTLGGFSDTCLTLGGSRWHLSQRRGPIRHLCQCRGPLRHLSDTWRAAQVLV